MPSSFELAAEAWLACCPEGMSQAEEIVRACLPGVAARIPGATICQNNARRTSRLFLSTAGEAEGERGPKFLRMLQPYRGQVHFLYFWRAFCKASIFITGRTNGLWEEGLFGEFDALRDNLLKGLAEEGDDRRLFLGTRQIVEAINRVASDCAEPDFWRRTAEAAAGIGLSGGGLDLEQLAVLVTSWHHDAREWQRGSAAAAQAYGPWDSNADVSLDLGRPPAPAAKNVRPRPPELEECKENIGPNRCLLLPFSPRLSPKSPLQGLATAAGCFCLPLGRYSPTSAKPQIRESGQSGQPVFVHIYDVSLEESVQTLNKVLANRFSPLKLGGIFHAGIEVGGMEWSFGYSDHDSVPGICCHEPRGHPDHRYRQSIQLKRTRLSQHEVAALIGQLIQEYPGSSYDLLRRNCCHFADDFAQRLGAGRLPAWVQRLARIGAAADGALQVAGALPTKVRHVLVPSGRGG
eukprot:CAMPEP_0170262752 /NCGR_PEP_ID=MMETSP0116_2-20130129/31260_1 /TAXON_ID=400756 /ORGANISM="Durinskia baltica, Strain CSIRO CS-38" /LENGTH=462 /DNA_ID=CAMNT_0010513823 /DNA_START=44 /DNA_END=1428 /DNA_ORIENTATION=-